MVESQFSKLMTRVRFPSPAQMTKKFDSDEQSEETPKQYWFVRKRYGWGWVPARWQGWAVLGAYTGGLVSIFWNIDNRSHSVSNTLINFFLPLVGITVILLIITYLTGEKPRWQWGEPPDKKDNL